jgi:hypothetical protein
MLPASPKGFWIIRIVIDVILEIYIMVDSFDEFSKRKNT